MKNAGLEASTPDAVNEWRARSLQKELAKMSAAKKLTERSARCLLCLNVILLSPLTGRFTPHYNMYMFQCAGGGTVYLPNEKVEVTS